MNQELKPCKACNSQFKPFLKPAYHGSLHGKPTGYWVGCECYNHTNLYDTQEQAIEAWNMRNNER